MRIYSDCADKDVDYIRTDMKTSNGGLHVSLEHKRNVDSQVTVKNETGSKAVISFEDTRELEDFMMILTQLKEMTKGYCGKWEIERGEGERL